LVIFVYVVYTQWDRLLADIGGMLGLFIGISACTAVEFIEFLIDAFLLGVAKCRLGTEQHPVSGGSSSRACVIDDVNRDDHCSECRRLQSSL
jgi:Amiloride-sensitive sodium channel